MELENNNFKIIIKFSTSEESLARLKSDNHKYGHPNRHGRTGPFWHIILKMIRFVNMVWHWIISWPADDQLAMDIPFSRETVNESEIHCHQPARNTTQIFLPNSVYKICNAEKIYICAFDKTIIYLHMKIIIKILELSLIHLCLMCVLKVCVCVCRLWRVCVRVRACVFACMFEPSFVCSHHQHELTLPVKFKMESLSVGTQKSFLYPYQEYDNYTFVEHRTCGMVPQVSI